MAIVIAQPHTWTLLGNGPLRIFPKSWRLGLVISVSAPAVDDPPDEVLLPNIGQEYNVNLPIYVKPQEEFLVAVGVSQIARIPSSDGNSAGGSMMNMATDSGLMPINLIPPGITGSPTVGSVLAVDLGAWTNAPTSYMYQILRDGTAVGGAGGLVSAPGVAYTVDAEDRYATLTVSSAASNDFGVGGPITSAGLTIS